MSNRDNFYDCIRAVAAALVLVRHYNHNLLPGGAIGVSIFFSLSGFLIARVLLHVPTLSPANIGKFIFHRFMRVWPLMAFQIFLTLGLMFALQPSQDFTDFISAVPGLLTFTGSVRWIGLSSAILWTLQAEFWFYILFALALFATGRAALIWLALAGIAAGWAATCFLGHGLEGSLAVYYPQPLKPALHTFIYLDQLMAGALCAWIVERNDPTVKAIFSNRALSLWLPLAAILTLATLRIRDYDLAWHLKSSAAAYLTGVLILHQWSKPLRGDYEPLATIGRISFSIYLLHAVILDYLPGHAFPQVLQFLAVTGLVVLASTLTYRCIERPFIRMSKVMAPFMGPSGLSEIHRTQASPTS